MKQSVFYLLPILVFSLFIVNPNKGFGQSEEEILNSIGNELEKESSKEKEAALIDKEYKALKAKADGAYQDKKYDKAKDYYSQMLALKPDSDYSKNKLAIIEQKIAAEKLAAKQKEYDELIKQADLLLASEKWTEATEKYKAASNLMPGEAYPKAQVAKMKKLQADAVAAEAAAEIQRKYDIYVSKGDAAKAQQNWEEATKQYTLASNTKADEIYPKDQIKLIVKLKKEAEEKAAKEVTDKKYNILIEGADQALKDKNWDEAKQKYTLASETKPQETYAKAQLIKVDQLKKEYFAKQEQIKIDATYTSQIQKADELYNSGSWNESIGIYQQAKTTKPTESYPSAQITKAKSRIQEELDAQKKAEQIETDFQKQKKIGEDALANENWLVAIEAFSAAKALKPQNTGIEDLLTQAKSSKRAADELALKSKAEQEAKEKTQNQFNSEMAIGTQAMSAKNWESARAAFKKAKSLIPDETLPDQKLSELDNLIAEEKAAKQEEEEKRRAEIIAEKERQEEQARLAAEKEAEEKARKIEEAKLAAELLAAEEAKKMAEEEAEKARILEEKRVAAEQQKQTNAQKEKEAQLAAQKAIEERIQKEQAAKLAAEAAAIAEAKKREEEKEEKIGLENEAKIKAELAEAKLLEDKKATQLAAAEEVEIQVKKQAEFDKAFEDYKAAIAQNDIESAGQALDVALSIFPKDKKVDAMERELIKLSAARDKELADAKASELKEVQNNQKYQELVSKGDQAVATSDFKKASEYFIQALELKPNEEYPTNKLYEIKELEYAANKAELAKQQEIEKAYGVLMTKGESAIGIKNWEEAMQSFQEAQKLKPDNNGPKERIAEVQNLIKREVELAKQSAAMDAEYNLRMKQGQEALDQRNFADAKRNFMSAFNMKPKEELPQEKLAETERLWELALKAEKEEAEAKKLAEIETVYTGFIQSGDQAFSSELWEEAIKNYQSALSTKPDEEYPKQRLKESKEAKEAALLFAEKMQKEEQARLKAEEEERIRLAEEAEALMKKEETFKLALSRGDIAMAEKDYKNAVSSYQKALQIHPDNSEVINKLTDANSKYEIEEAKRVVREAERKRLADIAMKKRQEAALKEREEYLAKIKQYSSEELVKNYPDGITEEIEEIESTVVTKSIIVENGEGRFLIRFTYPWGDEFYYIDGKKVRADAYYWSIKEYKF